MKIEGVGGWLVWKMKVPALAVFSMLYSLWLLVVAASAETCNAP